MAARRQGSSIERLRPADEVTVPGVEAQEAIGFSRKSDPDAGSDVQGVLRAPRDPQGAEKLANALRKLFAETQRDGHVRMHYLTTVTLAQRGGK